MFPLLCLFKHLSKHIDCFHVQVFILQARQRDIDHCITAITLMALPGVLPPQARFKSAWQGKMCSAIPFSMPHGWEKSFNETSPNIRAVLVITVMHALLSNVENRRDAFDIKFCSTAEVSTIVTFLWQRKTAYKNLFRRKLLSWRPRQLEPQRYLNQHLEAYKSHWFEAELSFRMKSWSQPNANEHWTNSSSACWGDTTAQVVRWSLKRIDCKTSSQFWSWLMHRYLTFMVSRIILYRSFCGRMVGWECGQLHKLYRP